MCKCLIPLHCRDLLETSSSIKAPQDYREVRKFVTHTHNKSQVRPSTQCPKTTQKTSTQKQTGNPINSIPPLNPTPKSFPPEATNTILLAPLLHHPSFQLIPNNLPLVNLRRRIFLLAPSGLDFRFEPLELRAETLRVKPSGEIFEDDGVV